MSYEMYRTEMLYTYFTLHGEIPERFFLPPRGPFLFDSSWKFGLFCGHCGQD